MVDAPMAWFEVKSPKRLAKIRLDASFFVIGRGERIPIFHDDPSISREHAAVVIPKTGAVRVRDLGSKNGVLLNGKTIGRYAETDLSIGDTLTIGATTLVLHEGEPPAKVAAPVVAKSAEPEGTGKAKTAEPADSAEASKPAAAEAPAQAPAQAPATPGALDDLGSAETAVPQAPAPAAAAAKLPVGTTALDELASDLRDEREQLGALRSAAESAAAAAVSARAAAASAAVAAGAAAAASDGSSDGEIQDLSEIEDKGSEPPPELLASDEDDLLELA